MQAQITNITKNALFFIKELVGLYFKKNQKKLSYTMYNGSNLLFFTTTTKIIINRSIRFKLYIVN